MITRIDQWLEKFEKALLIGLFLALMASMAINIIQRNLFGQSSQLTQELMPLMVLWISMVGASLGLRHGKHISMELFLRFVRPSFRKTIARMTAAFGALLMALGFYLSLDFMTGEIKIFGDKGYLSLVIPYFFAVTCFRYLLQIFNPHTHEHGEVLT